MKTLIKFMMIVLMTVAAPGAAGMANAQQPLHGKGQGVRGEVIAIGDSSLTLDSPNGDNVTVNVTTDTRIRFPEDRSNGSLSDIQTGNFAGVRGPRNDDGSITARIVIVLSERPRDMDRVRGKVTAIEGRDIVLENRDGSRRIATDDNTHFRIGKRRGSLGDINVDDPVWAIGNLQSDGTLQANLVVVVTARQLRKHTLRGDVLRVDAAAGVLTVEAKGQKEGIWTIETTDQTKYRIPGVENPSLADVEVGNHVGIVGRATGNGEKTGIARIIIVIPDEFKNSIRFRGNVTAISGSTFTVDSPRGEFTVLTDDETRYRTRGDQDVSFEDIKPGSKIGVIGEPIEGQDNTVQAKGIGIKLSTDR